MYSAPSRSWPSRISVARGMSSVTCAESLAISPRIESSSLWKPGRRSWACGSTTSWSWDELIVVLRSPEAAGDVVDRRLPLGVREDGLGVVHLHQLAGLAGRLDAEEGGAVGHARRLLHVVGDDHDRVALPQLLHQLL